MFQDDYLTPHIIFQVYLFRVLIDLLIKILLNTAACQSKVVTAISLFRPMKLSTAILGAMNFQDTFELNVPIFCNQYL